MAAAALVVVEREVLAPVLRRLPDRAGDAHARTGLHDHERVGPGEGWRVLLVLATSGGGTGRHVADLAAGLAVRGSEVTVAGPPGTLAALGLPPVVPTAEVAIAARPRPPADLRALRRLRALARKADVVHAHGVRAGALAVVAVRTLRRRPAVVVTTHNAAVGGRGVRAVHALLTAIVARGADAVLGVSGDLVAELRERGARNAGRALVPAPPQPPPGRTPEQVRADLGVPDGTALLVTVARLAPQKGLEVLLDALVVLRGRPLLAVVAGDGPLEGDLRRRADAEQLPLLLLGVRHDVPDLLAAADAVVVPSLWEGQSLLLQEALRAGAALVATDAGGNREVTADAALLVPAGDPAALAAGIATLLDDRAGSARLRVAARQRAAGLPTASDAVDQVTSLYARVLGRSS
jgi:glycosyltransferase involved in cell wall biosynthesis